MSSSWSNIFDLKNIGNYPKGYDPAKHGPFDPSRYYGKPDTAFGNVKLGELSSWFGRREIGLRPTAWVFSRAFWRWQMKYVQPRKSSPASFYQFAVACSILYYTMNYARIRGHRNYKYH